MLGVAYGCGLFEYLKETSDTNGDDANDEVRAATRCPSKQGIQRRASDSTMLSFHVTGRPDAAIGADMSNVYSHNPRTSERLNELCSKQAALVSATTHRSIFVLPRPPWVHVYSRCNIKILRRSVKPILFKLPGEAHHKR